MKQVYINHDLVGTDYSHDFDIIKSKENNDDITSLVRTHHAQWTKQARGKEAGRITDNGEGLLIEMLNTDGHRIINVIMDYDVAEELFILLSQQQFAEFEIRESKTTMKWPLSQ